MKQVVIKKAGSVENLVVEDAPNPEPAPDHVTIQVKAAGVNFADILARQGLYPDAPSLPCVIGYEVAGTVLETGDEISPDWRGKRVIAMTRFKGYSEIVSVPIQQVFELPAKLGFEEGAAIPVNYLTAWQLLVVMGGLQPEDTVLIHNAGGGVGLAALDIAKHIGATTYGTASPEKHHFLKQRGINETIDYRNGDWAETITSLTGGRGVELVIDALGGANWKKSFRALRPTGRLGMFGVSSATPDGYGSRLKMLGTAVQMPFFHPMSLMSENKSVFGVNLGHLWDENAKIRRWMDTILAGIETGWVQPHVDSSFTFEQAGEAHQRLEQRQNIGKVVLTP